MKKLLFLLLPLFLVLSTIRGQTITNTSAVPHTTGTPSGAPSTYGSWIRFDKTNKILYRWTGSAWTASLPGAVSDGDKGDITVSSSGTVWNYDTESIQTADIALGAITRLRLADDAVDAANIIVSAVGSSELADNAVDAGAIQNSAVDSSKIANGTISPNDFAQRGASVGQVMTYTANGWRAAAAGGGGASYLVYTALLSQFGTSAPTATVLENTLGGTVAWTRFGVGVYEATLTGAFTSGKTWASCPNVESFVIGDEFKASIDWLNSSTVSLLVYDLANSLTDQFADLSIEIRVYP